jgi:hypothetical protein
MKSENSFDRHAHRKRLVTTHRAVINDLDFGKKLGSNRDYEDIPEQTSSGAFDPMRVLNLRCFHKADEVDLELKPSIENGSSSGFDGQTVSISSPDPLRDFLLDQDLGTYHILVLGCANLRRTPSPLR